MTVETVKIIRAADIASADLVTAKAEAFDQLSRKLDAFAEGLTGSVPMAEKLSWATKEIAARAHVAASADLAQTALLQGEATITGETLSELATAIVGRADAYRIATAAIAGLRRKYSLAIDAATDVVGVQAALAGLESGIAALPS